jgi:hypothetical protein
MGSMCLNKFSQARWEYVALGLFILIQDHLEAQPAIVQQPNVIFYSGFEESPWRTVWSDYDGNPDSTNKVILNSGPFNTSGNHVMQLHVPSGRGGADVVKVLPQTYDKLYARWYEYWEPGYNFSAPNHGGGLFAGDRNYLGQAGNRPTGSDFVESWFEHVNGRPNLYTYYRGMYMDCTNAAGSCWGDHFPCFLDSGKYYCTNPADRPKPDKLPPILQTGKWYCIEQMIDLGTPTPTADGANGILNLWIDGVEYGPWSGLWFRTTASLKLTLHHLGLFHHDATHSVEGVYLDEVVVSTEPIGCHPNTSILPVGSKKKLPVQNNLSSNTKIILAFNNNNESIISLFNAAGKSIIEYRTSDRIFCLNKKDLPNGIYLMKIQTEGMCYTYTFVISH